MQYSTRILTMIPILFLLAACAPIQPPPPPDPLKEQLSTLQKQLLALQKIQADTSVKLEESNATIEALTGKVKELEEKQARRPVAIQPQPESRPTPTIQSQPEKKPAPVVKKKPARKTKKKIRRQE